MVLRRLVQATAINLLWTSLVLAQLTVGTRNAVELSGIESAEQIGGITFVEANATITKRPVVLVEATTEAANVMFDASDRDRVPVEIVQLTDKCIAIRVQGRTWVEVLALDFKSDPPIFARRMVIVELDDAPPDDDEDDPPGPTPPPDIANDYGLGEIAYKFAPALHADAVADLYKQAGDFLYGRPTAKTVDKILEWLEQETLKVPSQAGDADVFTAWKQWQEAIGAALLKSQRDRENGYTRADWFAAFGEIRKALEAK